MKRIISALLGISLALSFAANKFEGGQSYKPPRTSEGLPDLQGIWEAHNTADANIQKFLVGGGTLPYTPEAAKKKAENAKNAKTADPQAQCFMAGVPRTMYLHFPFQIFEGTGYALITSEYAHSFRYIRMDGSAHLDGTEFWMGDSRGHWDGDTLVVDTTGFTDRTWFDSAGNFHSGNLHVTERFTRTGQDVLTYEATIDDPKTYTKPFTIRMTMNRHTEKNFQIREHECYGI
jgi:hypothetical protein